MADCSRLSHVSYSPCWRNVVVKVEGVEMSDYDRDDTEIEPINYLGHVDFLFDGTPCCRVCGLVRPAEGWTRPCKGPSELSLRAGESK